MLLLFSLFCLCSYAQDDVWQVKKTAWSEGDERNYQNFIRSLGYAAHYNKCATEDGVCNSIRDLLSSEGNTYRASDPDWITQLHTDCADFILILRAYFAWKNFLPHAVANGAAPAGYCGVVSDTRFCNNGNKIVSRRAVQTGTSAKQVLLKWSVSPTTSIFRTHYLDKKGVGSDFYTPAIKPEGITPGTMIYDPNGHSNLVFDVLDDGRIMYLESKIDGTIDTGYLTSAKLPLGSNSVGWGFKKWKPVKIVGAELDANGNYIGGKTILPRATQVPGFSSVQYTGRIEGTENKYNFNGQAVTYHEFVRHKLARQPLRIDPVLEITQLVDAACNNLKDRVPAVKNALLARLPNDPHPERLPPNIYGTGGHWQWNHWETYSTPSRDAHIKTELKNIVDRSRSIIQRYRNNEPAIIYNGDNIAADMLKAYTQAAKQCHINYENSNKKSVRLDFLEITKRAFNLSFDPYHCVELRWGAAGEELNSCKKDANKMLWYKNQQFLRNQIDRRYTDRMNFTVEELASPRPGNGVAKPPDINVIRFLQSQI